MESQPFKQCSRYAHKIYVASKCPMMSPYTCKSCTQMIVMMNLEKTHCQSQPQCNEMIYKYVMSSAAHLDWSVDFILWSTIPPLQGALSDRIMADCVCFSLSWCLSRSRQSQPGLDCLCCGIWVGSWGSCWGAPNLHFIVTVSAVCASSTKVQNVHTVCATDTRKMGLSSSCHKIMGLYGRQAVS